MSKDIVQPLVNLKEKDRPNRPQWAGHLTPSEINHLCRLLASDIRRTKHEK